MELKTAKQVLMEAINIALTKGCFGLVEAANILKALEAIEASMPEQPVQEEQ